MKFCTRVCLKPSNDRGEFELDRAKIKNYIAENSVALGHETHNNSTALERLNSLLDSGKFLQPLITFGNNLDLSR